MDKLEEIVEKVLIGIDLTEIESENGWWETSVGAKFGRKKKLELIKTLKRYLTSTIYSDGEKQCPNCGNDSEPVLHCEHCGHNFNRHR